MNKPASSFIAGLLAGIALTAGVAAVLVRLGGGETPVFVASGDGGGSIDAIKTRSLRLAHGMNTEHPVHVGLVRFAEIIHDRTGGRITVQIFPNGELGDETVTIEQLQTGTLDFAKASAAPLGSFSPDFAVFSVPYAFRDAEHCFATLDGPVGREILDTLDNRGLHGLCYLDAGARSFYTAGDPILQPDDLVGLKVRVMESKTAMDMVSAFGGSPTPMAYSELYSALQSGLVDAAENNPPSFYSSRHYEVSKHFTLNEHSRVPDVLMVNGRTWRELSPAARTIIEDASVEASRYQRVLWAERTDEALGAVRALGVEVHEVNMGAFGDGVEQLKASYADTRVGELLSRIAAIETSGG